MKAAAIENNAGKFVLPDDLYGADAATAIALKVLSLSSLNPRAPQTTIANALSVVDCPYKKPKKGAKLTKAQKTLRTEQSQAYPMSTFTYVILRPDAGDIALLKQFVNFAISPREEKRGQNLQFAPLPSAVYKADKAAVNAL